MKPTLVLITITILLSCTHQSNSRKTCNIDSNDEGIYKIVIEKYIIPEIDSCIHYDSIKDKLYAIKNNRKNLLLRDSTKKFVDHKINFISDSVLINNFIISNKTSCKIILGQINSSKMLPFSQEENAKFFNKNKSPLFGFSSLYKKYPDVSGIVELSKIGFNLKKDKALLEICFYQGPLAGFGLMIILKNENGNWKIENEFMEWVS